MWTTSGNGHGGIGGGNRLRKGSKGRSGRNAPIVNQLRNDDFSNFELLANWYYGKISYESNVGSLESPFLFEALEFVLLSHGLKHPGLTSLTAGITPNCTDTGFWMNALEEDRIPDHR